MTRDEINALCAALPGATLHDPWGGGHDVWKVGGKMFASMGTQDRGVAFKCPDPGTAQMLIDIGVAEVPMYLTRGGWVFVTWDALDDDDLGERLRASHATVAATLTRKARAEIGID